VNVHIIGNSSEKLKFKKLLMIFIFSVIYYLIGRLVLLLNPESFNVVHFWPVAGLSVFWVLRYGVKVIAGVFVGQLVLSIDLNNAIQNFQNTQQILLFIGLALNASLFSFLARYLILRYTHFQGNILEKTNIPFLLFLAGPVSSFIPMLISIYLLTISGIILSNDIVPSILIWWFQDSFSVVIFLPVLLLFFNTENISFSQKRTVFIVVTVLLTATFAMFKYAEQKESQHLERILNNRGIELAQKIKNEMQQHMHSARHLTAYVDEGHPLSLQKFNQFSSNLLNEHKSIGHLQWGDYVNEDERDVFEKKLRRLYQNEYLIKEKKASGKVVISPPKNDYYPVKFVFPYDENKSALGLDPTVGQGVLNNLLIAIENGEETLSRLTARGHESTSYESYIVLYTPFYLNQKSKRSVDRKIEGYLSQAINLRLFFEALTESRLYSNIQIKIIDSTENLPTILFSNNTGDIAEGNQLKASHSFYLANKVWTVEMTKKNGLSDNSLLTAGYFLISGLFITMVFIVVLLKLIQKQQILQQKLHKKTVIVKESESYQNLLSATFNTHQAILITDPEYNIIRVNSAFCDIMGYTEVEVVGENPRMLASGKQSLAFYKDMWTKLLGTGRYEGEIWNRRKNGEIFPEYQTITEIRNAQGEIIYYISVFSDITKLKQDEEKIRHQAFYDQLTLLPNRLLFLDRLDQERAIARRFDGVGALLLIDIDNFKSINDSIGHHFGDDVLIELGKRLSSMLRETDTVAHLGGDDFVVLMPVVQCNEQDAKQHALIIAEKILIKIQQPFLINKAEYNLSASLGISFIKKNKCTASDILRQTELALYKAKMAGKNCLRIYLDD